MSTPSLINLFRGGPHGAGNPEEVASALVEAGRQSRKQVVFRPGTASRRSVTPRDRVLLDMSAFDKVEIDPLARTARIGGATQWMELISAANEHGLTAPARIGRHGRRHRLHMMGGGVGFMSRHLGLGSSAIRSAELVMPDGRIRRIDAGSDPDLFWALRGGGGGFGVITELEIELTLCRGWPVECSAGASRTRAVLGAWSEWTRRIDDDVTSAVRFVHPPEGRP